MDVLKVHCEPGWEVHPRHLVAKIYPRKRWVSELRRVSGPVKPDPTFWDMPFNTPETLDLPAAFDAPPLTFSYRLCCHICRSGVFLRVNGNQLRDIVWEWATRRDCNSLTLSELEDILTL